MRRRFPIYPGCPVCGDRAVNPSALEVRWWWDEEDRLVVGQFVPGAQHAGYAGRLHGGLLSAMLDECLAWACAVRTHAYCMTGQLDVRFKRPAPIGEPLELIGRVGEGWGRYVRATGEARSSSGMLLASASATFAALSREESEALHRHLVLEPGDVDVLAVTGDRSASAV